LALRPGLATGLPFRGMQRRQAYALHWPPSEKSYKKCRKEFEDGKTNAGPASRPFPQRRS